MLVGIGFVAVLWYGGLLVIRGRISVGQFVTFQLFLGRLIWPMIAIGWTVNLTQRGTASLARIRAIVDTVPAIRDEEPLAAGAEIAGGLRFHNLELRVPSGDCRCSRTSTSTCRRGGRWRSSGGRAPARARCWR